MRGEHSLAEKSSFAYEGSSPHARGAHVVIDRCWISEGIIPACAGSTLPDESAPNCDRDHPRMRGEHAPLFL